MDFNKNPKAQAAQLTLYFLSQTLNPERAIDCAKFHIDGLLDFSNHTLQGWLDADIISYLNQVKAELSNFNLND